MEFGVQIYAFSCKFPNFSVEILLGLLFLEFVCYACEASQALKADAGGVEGGVSEEVFASGKGCEARRDAVGGGEVKRRDVVELERCVV